MATIRSRNRRVQLRRPRVLNETTDELATALGRLRDLGATEDEVAAFAAGWDDFDAEWTPESRSLWVRQSDSVIRAELEAIRLEHFFHTHTEAEEAEVVATIEHERLTLEAARIVATRTVADVLVWVDGDPVRAGAALEAERGAPNTRVTLVRTLEQIADAEVVAP